MRRDHFPVSWRIVSLAMAVSISPVAMAHASTEAYGTADLQRETRPDYIICEGGAASVRDPAPVAALTALERISARQQGGDAKPDNAALPARSADVTRASISTTFIVEPASDPVPTPAAGCSTPPVSAGPEPADWRPYAADAPNSELGTIAIPIARTAFDDRWRRASRTPPAALMRAELRRAGVTDRMGQAEIAQRVNQWVNHRIQYIEDRRNYRENDVWATAEQTVASGRGDCEDFAILKMQMLLAAGIGAGNVKLVLLRDLVVNADHALLLVSSDAGKLALDNMTDRVYDGSRANDFRPILSFSGTRRWVHGYADARPVQMAQATPAAKEASILPGIARPAGPMASLAAIQDRPAGSGPGSFRLTSIRYRAALLGRGPIFGGLWFDGM